VSDEQQRATRNEETSRLPQQPPDHGALEPRTPNLPLPLPNTPGQAAAPPRRVALFFVSVPTAILAFAVLLILIGAAFYGGLKLRPTSAAATTAATTTAPSRQPSPQTSASTPPSPTGGAAVGSPSAQPSSAPTSAAASVSAGSAAVASGTVIAQYKGLNLPINEGIPFQAGKAPTPTTNTSAMDLQYASYYTAFYTTTGTLALLQNTAPTYQQCVGDTIRNTDLNPVQAHESVCYVGANVVAIATVDSYNSLAGTYYATLDVTVWQK